jgi:hypothetical protein
MCSHKMCKRCVKWTRKHCATAKYMATKRLYNRTPERRDYFRVYNSSRDMKEYFRLYNHRPMRREQIQAWGKAHPESLRTAFRKWARTPKGKAIMKSHAHNRRARFLGNGGSWTASEWVALVARYGHRCLACGLGEVQLRCLRRKLVPDHVIPLVHDGRNDISNLQPLCHGTCGCNNRKGARHTDYRKRSTASPTTLKVALNCR